MPTNSLVVFALKEEFSPWRRRHRFRPVAGSPHAAFTAAFGPLQVLATLAGAGAPDAQNIDNLVERFRPSFAIVTGVAAGLKAKWRPGDIIVAECASEPVNGLELPSSPDLVELARKCGAEPVRTLVTLPHIIRTVAEKIQLGHSADAADMESIPLMHYWSKRSIPSLALRVILDPVEMPMTCDFERTIDAHGRLQTQKLIAHLAGHPQLLPDFLRLARQSRRALLNLAGFLDRFFEQLKSSSLDTHS